MAVGLSLRAYAAHRAALGLPGQSAPSVMRAIKSGRLKLSIEREPNGDAKIADPGLADREWAASTDHSRAPADVKVAAANQPPGVVTELEPQPHGGALKRQHVPPPPEGEPGADGQPEGDTLANASNREKHWKAKSAELKYRQEAGELVVAAEYEKALVTMLGNVRTKLLGVPSKYKARYMDTPLDRIKVLDTLIIEALSDLASGAALANVGDDDPEDLDLVQQAEAVS